MSESQRAEMENRQRRHQVHQANLNGHQDDQGAAEILRYVASLDDIPIDEDDELMRGLATKLLSTANLSAEEVKSTEWVIEYLLILYLSERPRKEGVHTEWRAWSHADQSADIEPLPPDKRRKIEQNVTLSKVALSRSKDMEALKETTRNVKESYVRNEDEAKGGSGGILGRLGLK